MSQPVIENGGYTFTVKVGKPPAEAKAGTKAGKREHFRCLMSNVPIDYDYIRDEAMAGRMGQKLMAIVAEGTRAECTSHRPPNRKHVAGYCQARLGSRISSLPDNPRHFDARNYGMTTSSDLFTPRQLVALTTFSDLVGEARERIRQDAIAAGLSRRRSRPRRRWHRCKSVCRSGERVFGVLLSSKVS